MRERGGGGERASGGAPPFLWAWRPCGDGDREMEGVARCAGLRCEAGEGSGSDRQAASWPTAARPWRARAARLLPEQGSAMGP
jgi:hypothetical protein